MNVPSQDLLLFSLSILPVVLSIAGTECQEGYYITSEHFLKCLRIVEGCKGPLYI